MDHRLSFAFGVYDVDKSGYLDFNKLDTVIHPMMKLINGNVERDLNSIPMTTLCMRLLDLNKTGKISRDDFTKGLRRNQSLRILMSPFN